MHRCRVREMDGRKESDDEGKDEKELKREKALSRKRAYAKKSYAEQQARKKGCLASMDGYAMTPGVRVCYMIPDEIIDSHVHSLVKLLPKSSLRRWKEINSPCLRVVTHVLAEGCCH